MRVSRAVSGICALFGLAKYGEIFSETRFDRADFQSYSRMGDTFVKFDSVAYPVQNKIMGDFNEGISN